MAVEANKMPGPSVSRRRRRGKGWKGHLAACVNSRVSTRVGWRGSRPRAPRQPVEQRRRVQTADGGASLHAEPSGGGWRDVMINYYLKSDEAKHVCELQLVHASLLTARKGLPGHVVYGRGRNALELMEKIHP